MGKGVWIITMKRIIFAFILLSTFVSAVTAYSRNIMSELNSSLIRLHVIAESDSEYDQSIKLAVRDSILDAVKDISAKDTDKFTAAAQNAADTYLKKNNIPYSAHAEYGSLSFPRKSYGDITLPAGEYKGIRVTLGSGKGHNWWCIMYPPLCVSGNDAHAGEQAKKELESSLDNGTYDLISSDKPEVRFRMVELINALRR